MHGADLKEATVLPIENTTKATVRVETRQATPIDGAFAGDERGGMAVSDQRIFGDPWVHDVPVEPALFQAGRNIAFGAGDDPEFRCKRSGCLEAGFHVRLAVIAFHPAGCWRQGWRRPCRFGFAWHSLQLEIGAILAELRMIVASGAALGAAFRGS